MLNSLSGAYNRSVGTFGFDLLNWVLYRRNMIITGVTEK
jgi:hypothetical protein